MTTQAVGKIFLSHKRVRELLDYNPRTGWMTWKVVPKYRSGVIKVGDRAGSGGKRGRSITVDCQWYAEHRLIWFWVTGKSPLLEIDHKDRNRSNNRWTNLRLATTTQNQHNVVYLRKNSTGYRGVGFSTRSRRGNYFAKICKNGKQQMLGYFTTAEEAFEAYKAEAKKLRGEFYSEPPPVELSV